MHILSGKTLPRRTFLRGMGAMVALPYLDAMEPVFRGLGKRALAGGPTDKTRFVAIESGADAVLAPALADRFQLQPDDGEGWCVGPGHAARNDSER